MTNPVVIRGVYYASQTKAAKALGISRGSVSHALERGAIDNIGLGKTGRPGRQVSIRGVTYPSITAASIAIGVSIEAIVGARRRGTLDNVGMRKYRHD